MMRLIAIAISPASTFDDTIACSNDRRAARSGPIDAGMHAGIAKDRMTAHAKG